VLDADLPSLIQGLLHPGLILHGRADRVGRARLPFRAPEALYSA
jgi:hypothetical protein